MTLFELYLCTTVLPNLSTLSGIALFLSFVSVLASCIAFFTTSFERNEELLTNIVRVLKIALITTMVSGVLSVFTPDTKQLVMMTGGYYATNTQAIAKLPENIAKAANAWLAGIEKGDKK